MSYKLWNSFANINDHLFNKHRILIVNLLIYYKHMFNIYIKKFNNKTNINEWKCFFQYCEEKYLPN